jgi:tRNA(His) guanylyltransferase
MGQSLPDRQLAYEEDYNFRITRRIPVVIRLNLRLFPKVTRRIQRPYCTRMIELMSHTLLDMAKQIDGAIFGYYHDDELIFILKNNQTNDTDPWFGNRVQKISSASAATATYLFNRYHLEMSDPPDLSGQPIFMAHTFPLPDVTEVTNYLIFKQQMCITGAITQAAKAELAKEYGIKKANKILEGKDINERQDILVDYGIDFMEYPSAFRNGIGTYVSGDKNKWILDVDLPYFTDNTGSRFIYGVYFNN